MNLEDYISKGLRVTVQVTEIKGTKVGVGERFGARFTITNVDDRISFSNISIRFYSTYYASPTNTNAIQLNNLGPGLDCHLDMVFIANRTGDVYTNTVPGKPTAGQVVLQHKAVTFASCVLNAQADIPTLSVSESMTLGWVDIDK